MLTRHEEKSVQLKQLNGGQIEIQVLMLCNLEGNENGNSSKTLYR